MMLNNHFMAAAAATVAAASAAAFFGATIDCNPSLYLYDRLLVTEQKLYQHFDGKRIWITGASSGIGAELAKQLAALGVELILSGRSHQKLEIVASECRTLRQERTNMEKQGADEFSKIMTLPLDMACSQEEMEQAVDRVLYSSRSSDSNHQETESPQELDCVVLNAGIGHQSSALETDRTTTEQMMAVNALGPIHMAQTIIQKNYKHWISNENNSPRRGHFVITSSVGGKFALPLSASYAASKHALHGYFNSLRSEYPSLCIDILCPGPIATPFFDQDPQPQAGDPTQQPVTITNTKKKKTKELKLSPERCARLMMSSMMYQQQRHNAGKEFWIAKQPTLFFCYLSQYLPSIATLIVNRIGPLRVAMWEAGLDLYDPQSFKTVVKLQQEQKASRKSPAPPPSSSSSSSSSSSTTMSIPLSEVSNNINTENAAETRELQKTKESYT